MFLRRGVSLNSQLVNTILRDKVFYGRRCVIVELLLKLRANLNFLPREDNIDDPDGKAALHYACGDLHIPSAKLLLAAGADARLLDKQGNSAMMLAESPQIVEMMLAKGVDVNHTNEENYTALLNAAMHGNIEVVRTLLKAGADVHVHGGDGWTALCAAVGNNHEYIASLLLHAGANANDEHSGHPALFDAAKSDSPGLIHVLVKHGAEVSKVYSHGSTALFKAVKSGNRMVVEKLLQVGANVHVGKPPLFAAIANGDVEIAKLLLDHGVDLENTDKDGYTSLLRAVEDGHEQIVCLLLSKSANVHTVDCAGAGANLLCLAADQGNSTVVDRLLETVKQSLDSTDLYGRTALFRAAIRGHDAVVERLLSYDPMPNLHKKDHWDATALAMASRNGHTSIVCRLLRAGQYTVDMLREKDRAGRGIYNAGTEQRTDVAEEGMMSNDGEKVVLTFVPNTCYCDVCGRCSTCNGVGQTMTCKECHTDGGGNMLICCFCVAAGLQCLNTEHIWEVYENCPCQDKDSDDEQHSEDEDENEEDEEKNEEGEEEENDDDE
ncbi:hypothetical protein Golomagni_05204 [Golovinomyces magnicellulatus]|nr:hypothetical protein Golomagni_05204 [Golovinomyces magnicellulatus]